MGHYIADLKDQQTTLAHSEYDLRITNLARFIHRKLPQKFGSFMDIGAGNGLVLKFFKKKGFTVTGMELSPDLCRLMKKDPKLRGISITPGDISKVKGKPIYNYVLASDVIEHIKDDTKALKNLFSFVRPGGTLIITVPAHSFLFGKRDRQWGHYRRYNKKDLKKKLQQLEGTITFIGFWNFVGFFPYLIFERVLRKPIREEFRYKATLLSRLIRAFVAVTLRVEELLGGTPLGLTLVAMVKKNNTT